MHATLVRVRFLDVFGGRMQHARCRDAPLRLIVAEHLDIDLADAGSVGVVARIAGNGGVKQVAHHRCRRQAATVAVFNDGRAGVAGIVDRPEADEQPVVAALVVALNKSAIAAIATTKPMEPTANRRDVALSTRRQ